MAAEQGLALVVRGTDWSETSRITTLFTLFFKHFSQALPVEVTSKVTKNCDAEGTRQCGRTAKSPGIGR